MMRSVTDLDTGSAVLDLHNICEVHDVLTVPNIFDASTNACLRDFPLAGHFAN
jgi:tRNA A-37 threonylcarbamoyl transferase component Bud32